VGLRSALVFVLKMFRIRFQVKGLCLLAEALAVCWASNNTADFFFFFLSAKEDHCIQFMVRTKKGNFLNSLNFVFVMSSVVLLSLFNVKDIF